MNTGGRRTSITVRVVVATLALTVTFVVAASAPWASATTATVAASTSTISDARFTAMDCPSTSDCFAVGSDTAGALLVATTDGGAKWKHQTTLANTSLNAISCSSTTNCEAVGIGPGNGVGNARILGTTNGGAAWTVQKVPAAINTPNGADLTGISCPSVTRCQVVGNSGFFEDQGGTVVQTTGIGLGTVTDGTTWKVQKLPAPVAVAGGSMAAIDCGSTTVCTALGTEANSSDPVVLSAGVANATASWTVGSVLTSDGLPGSMGSEFSMSGIACATATSCEAVGGQDGGPDIIAHINAGGLLGTFQPPPTDGGEATLLLSAVACPSTRICEAVGTGFFVNSQLLATTNGGGTWNTQNVPTSASTLTAVSCASVTVCQAAGEGTTSAATIIGTTNGGKTWTKEVNYS
jgi:hypothetical protein